MRHVILLPYKENYSRDIAGAASIWVYSYLQKSSLKNQTTVFGNLDIARTPLTKNFINIPIKTKLFSKTNEYMRKFCEIIKDKKVFSVEVHNRPQSIKFLVKKKLGLKLYLFFHNDPNLLNYSKSYNEKLFLINNCDKIFFVSNWVKEQFFLNLPFKNKNNCQVLYPALEPQKNIPKKDNIIIFSGKLNHAKGYDLFLSAISKILDEFHDWKCFVAGNEPREKITYVHPNFNLLGWINHGKLINFYKKSAISVVPSTWDEPFGRTAMESSACGCVTIISNKGGLPETFKAQKNVILKNLTSNEIYNKIKFFIINKNLRKKYQLSNFKNPVHILEKKVKTLDEIKKQALYKLNYFKVYPPRVLHIGNFNNKNSFRIFNLSIAQKISNGLLFNNCDVINFDYRNYEDKRILVNTNKKVLDICHNYKPNLLILGHTNLLSRNTLEILKKNNCKISMWFEDAVHKGGPDNISNKKILEKNSDLINNFFITTHPSAINASIPKDKAFFMPVPADPLIEILHAYKYQYKTKDVFFGLSHGVNYGKLKRNVHDGREILLNKLLKFSDKINFEFLGINSEEPQWNFDFYDSLLKCKMALNLSRGTPAKYYSSNRIASYVGNGIPTLIDSATQYNNFFSNREAIFYDNDKDLIDKIIYFKDNIKALKKIGEKGKKKYLRIFNNKLVSKFIIQKSFNKKISSDIIWYKK